jgi:serpin B
VLTESLQTGQAVGSDLPRIVEPDASSEEVARLSQDNADFAFALLGALGARDTNLFYSPHSISTALAMLYAGAQGDTARQMAHALHYGLDPPRLHPAFNALDLALASRADAAPPTGGEPFQLNVVNQLWGQQGHEFLASYLDLIAQHYGANLMLLDFAADPDTARAVINDWISERTEQRIPELLPAGSVDTLTVLVLTNAIYFRASWQSPFDAGRTVEAAFVRLDGSEVEVPTMRQTLDTGYAEGEGWAAAELDYVGEDLSMVLLVPEAGTLDAFEASLDGPRVRSILADLETRNLALSLPRFTVRSRPGLKSALMALGMRDAFGASADFSGIDGTRELSVSDVVHEGWISVDETGTEAAAATAVVVVSTAMREPAVLTVDRPFLFLIRDVPTGAILFVGRVVDPSVLADMQPAS